MATVAQLATRTAHPAVQCKLKCGKLDASSMLASLAATTKTFVDKNCPWRTEPYPFVSVQFADDKLGYSWTNRVVAPATTHTWDGKTAKMAFWNQSPLRAVKAGKINTLDSGDDDENDWTIPTTAKTTPCRTNWTRKIDAELHDTDE
ncbi:hypothetical protein H257_15571 [Aphanomyces astaci]|nr:hypothetical protein H257_15571 [Aphanomyces astaci]ETV68596.1 hypothetical protein H257_15571 [Aphanomyces astaci]|eukprot:XP_009842025.1 hypothetical protein H257_15571 [Aphanomyces astaci]